MADKPQQLSLNLPVETRFGQEDFLVSPSNALAYGMFERWPEWPGRVLLLIGPAGAGKSHLASIWAERAAALTIHGAALANVDLPMLSAGRAIVVEDADQALNKNNASEAALFHLINMARDSNAFLVLTARAFPDRWGLATADLLSRLRLAPAVEIGAPDDALVRAVLVKLFDDRQLGVDAGLIEYLAVRIERSLGAARATVEALDREAMGLGRSVTRQLAGELLRRMDSEV